MKKLLMCTIACMSLAGTSYASDVEEMVKKKPEKESTERDAFGHCGGSASFVNGRGETVVYSMDPVSSVDSIECNQLFGKWLKDTATTIGGSVSYYTNLFTDK